jgi:uncharacterized damage-inducible protein DinB
MHTTIKHYVNAFENLYDGEPWYGKSIMSIIKEVAPSKAYKKSSDSQHSIYEILHHMLAWRELFVSRLNGDTTSSMQINSSLDWGGLPSAQTSENWNRLLTRLSENQEALVQALGNQKDNQLGEEFANSNASLETHLEGNLQHDIYHLGQIAILNKVYSLTTSLVSNQ